MVGACLGEMDGTQEGFFLPTLFFPGRQSFVIAWKILGYLLLVNKKDNPYKPPNVTDDGPEI